MNPDWFAQRLLAWHDTHGRKDLPWQQDITPYRVWVSEIMLQQTQVATVIDYFQRFMRRFPDVHALADAHLDEVLHEWTGLGYYARARNLHKTAAVVAGQYDGEFPTAQEALEALPGIGRSTAGAIRAIAHQLCAPILDANVKRVLARFHNLSGYPGTAATAKSLWQAALSHTPASETRKYTQAIMDLGATVCTTRNALCTSCPLAGRCQAHALGRVDDLPTPKPRKEKPVRCARFFVLTTPGHATLLEQKPLAGIWGGLWTPPQRESGTSTEEFLAEFSLARTDVAREHTAPTFRHTFSHYHLDIEPVYLHLTEAPTLVQDRADIRWIFPGQRGDNARIGLTKPAVRLLESLQEPFPT